MQWPGPWPRGPWPSCPGLWLHRGNLCPGCLCPRLQDASVPSGAVSSSSESPGTIVTPASALAPSQACRNGSRGGDSRGGLTSSGPPVERTAGQEGWARSRSRPGWAGPPLGWRIPLGAEPVTASRRCVCSAGPATSGDSPRRGSEEVLRLSLGVTAGSQPRWLCGAQPQPRAGQTEPSPAGVLAPSLLSPGPTSPGDPAHTGPPLPLCPASRSFATHRPAVSPGSGASVPALSGAGSPSALQLSPAVSCPGEDGVSGHAGLPRPSPAARLTLDTPFGEGASYYREEAPLRVRGSVVEGRLWKETRDLACPRGTLRVCP